MKFIFFKCCLVIILCLASALLKAQDTVQKVIANRYNSKEQQQKPYLILISADGFRWDFADKYGAKNLKSLRKEGVEASYMQASYPSLTFPNHYTIATGLYPAHHGIVDNIFYDKKRNQLYKKSDSKIASDSTWYNGIPLWVLAEQQQMLSAVFYWPGSEIAIQGIKPSYYYNYNEIISLDKRLIEVKNWLNLPEEKRPHLIAFYFPQVDKAAHNYGPESEQVKAAVHLVDNAVGALKKIADSTGLNVNFIFLSDHGMTKIDEHKAMPLPANIDLSRFTTASVPSVLHLYAKEKKYIKSTYKALKKDAKDYDVYLAKNLPKPWHYNKANDRYNRIGDILLVPHLPCTFNINQAKIVDVGQHGFDPSITDMHATFYAWGPAFNLGLNINAFENIHVYPLIAYILGLNYSHKIDGRLKVLKPILRQPKSLN